jgi:hypothetical protein
MLCPDPKMDYGGKVRFRKEIGIQVIKEDG